MTDYKFRLSRYSQGYGAKAVWWGVYAKLADPRFHEDPIQSVYLVQNQWRSRLAELYNADYKPLQGAKFQYARNCPPVCVHTRPSSRSCNLRRICPFCYARLVILPAWERVKLGAFDKNHPHYTVYGCDVIRFEYVRDFVFLEDAVDDAFGHRNREIGNIQAIHGGLLNISIYPRSLDKFRVRRAGFAIVKRGFGLKKVSLAHTSYVNTGCMRRAQISKMVARSFRYPEEYLRSDPRRTIAILDAIRGRRTQAFCGTFYCKH